MAGHSTNKSVIVYIFLSFGIWSVSIKIESFPIYYDKFIHTSSLDFRNKFICIFVMVG